MAGLNKRTATVGAYASGHGQESSSNRKQHEAQENDQKLQVRIIFAAKIF